jgi:hypothetical protein
VAEDSSSGSKADLHMQHLKGLDKTFVPPPLTKDQEEERKGRPLARAMWQEVLKAVLEDQHLFSSEATEPPESPNDRAVVPSRFFDLPAELRNMAYLYCLDDTKDENNMNDTRLNRHDLAESAPWGGPNTSRICAHLWRPRSTHEYFEWNLCEEVKRTDAHRQNLKVDVNDHVRQAYEDYIASYQVNIKEPCEHDVHSDNAFVLITERGDVCENLPCLALTCRQILGEMWTWIFSTSPATITKKTKYEMIKLIRYTAKVKDFDFFPAFRFFQMLRRLPGGIRVQGKIVDIVLKDESEKHTHVTKYGKVKRLIEAHWLEGLPLWGCLTGLRKENGFEDLHKKERTGKGRFWGWMYSVRQVVVLYHIRRTLWRDTSVACLKCWNAFEGDDDKDE